MTILLQNISDFFDEILSDLNCQKDTKAYIISTFEKYKVADHDLSQYSIGELFCQARQKHEFAIYQNIGDWIFFCNSFVPQYLKNATRDYYDNIARLSYYSCYNLINRQWRLFEELADRLVILEDEIKRRFPKL
jgi:hypothetical protein